MRAIINRMIRDIQWGADYMMPKDKKTAIVMLCCVVSTVSEAANSIPGTGDGIFWLRNGFSNNSTHYSNAEEYFADYPNWNKVRLFVSCCVGITHFYFISGCMLRNDDELIPSLTCNFSRTRCVFKAVLWTLALVSNAAEGISSMPGLAYIVQLATCDHASNECDQSAEVFINQHLGLLLVIMGCAIVSAYVDYCVEGDSFVTGVSKRLLPESANEHRLFNSADILGYGALNEVSTQDEENNEVNQATNMT
jgi:hypothetical protein